MDSPDGDVTTARPPRVVFLTHVARPSGAEIALVRLIKALGSEIDAHVVLGEDGPLVGRLREVGATVLVLPLHPGARDTRKDAAVGAGLQQLSAVLRTFAYVVRLRKVIRGLRPDVVHANSLKACLYGGAAGRLAGVPVLWHVRDRITDDYLPVAAVRLVRALGRVLPSAVVFNSESTRRAFGATPQSWVVYNAVVPDAVDLATPGPRPSEGDDHVVGVVGRLAPWKGQDVFLRAFARAFPTEEATARLIGSAMFGEQEYEAELRGLVADLGLEHRVELRGFRDDITSELAELDVLVHCSTLPEPFGQVVVEALAAGVPVIAADAGGPAEIITDGVDGLLTPPGDVPALAAALRRLRDDGSLRAELSARGPSSAQRFSPAVLSAGLLEVYGAVRAQRSSARRVTAARRRARARLPE